MEGIQGAVLAVAAVLVAVKVEVGPSAGSRVRHRQIPSPTPTEKAVRAKLRGASLAHKFPDNVILS
jgi:hypothetical protein